MAMYQTPGVYYERIDATAPAISAIRMDVAGFVGIALRGPIDTPLPVESWRQFQAHFGEFTGSGFLAYTVRAFFENGGRRCWIARVASLDPNGGAMPASKILQSPAGKDIWRLAASSPGSWGNDLTISLRQTHRAQTRSKPHESIPNASAVLSTSGFARGTMVCLSQDGAEPIWKVVSAVDPVEHRLIWVHEKPAYKFPYDSPVEGFDQDEPMLIESVEYTLVVKALGQPIALYEGLSLVPEHQNYGPRVLAPVGMPTDFEAQRTLPAAPKPVVLEELRPLPLQTIEPIDRPIVNPVLLDTTFSLTGGASGLMLLTSSDFTGEDSSPLDSEEQQKQKRRGIRALDLIDEVAIVAVPDIHVVPVAAPGKAPLPPSTPDPCLPQESIPPVVTRPPTTPELPPLFSADDIYRIQTMLVQHCEERGDRIALLDPPRAASLDDELGIAAIRAWRSRFDSKYAAFYYPWLRVVDPLRSLNSITRDIPPSGHVAGQYATSDFEIGVHKAPANSPLFWAQDVTVVVNDTIHGILNPLGINVIRPLASRGIRILGARTASSDPDWYYVNVRRLLMMVKKAVYLSTQWAAFEPNDVYTRAKLRLALTSFLIALWEQGALVGSTAQEAFFVKCDEENNPAQQRDNGQLLAEVGIAPSRPFEFVVLRIGRADNEFEISELSMRISGGR